MNQEQCRKKIFEFITNSENFDTIWELYDLFPDRRSIFREIIFNFIKALEKSIKQNPKSKGWSVEIILDEKLADPGVFLILNDWLDYFQISLQSGIKSCDLYYGLLRDIDSFSFLKNKKVNDAAKNIGTLSRENGFKSEQWFIGIKYLNKFLEYEYPLKSFLDNFNNHVKEYSNLLLDFAESIKDDVTKKLVPIARSLDPKYKKK